MNEDKKYTVDDVISILGSTVKHDNENKAITFLTMLLTYTEEEQINIGYLAESSTGKSYIPLEISAYFPQEDVVKLGYASPTAFFHDYGVLMLKEGIPVNFEMKPSKAKVKLDLEFDKGDYTKEDVEIVYKRQKREWNQLLHGSYYLVDLAKKIVIFLDMPHDVLLQRLRPLLSHDEKTIVLKITDKRDKAGLRTKTVVVKGFSTVIFCSAKSSMEEQEKTRLLLLSPEISQEKLRESIVLKIEKESDREAFIKGLMENPQRKMLAERVKRIKEAKIGYIIISEELREMIYQKFMENHSFLMPRHQRDISRLLALIKAHALLNFMYKKRVNDSVIVEMEDVEAGFRLYSQISEANEMGLPPEIFRVFQHLKACLEDREDGLTRKDFQQWYFNTYHKVIGRDRASDILKILVNVGLLIEQPDSVDRRLMRYVLPEVGVKNFSKEDICRGQIVLEPGQNEIIGKKEKISPPGRATHIFCTTKGNVEFVFNGLVEASRVRGSATVDEIASEAKLPKATVEALLKVLEREGKAFSPYPDWWKVV